MRVKDRVILISTQYSHSDLNPVWGSDSQCEGTVIKIKILSKELSFPIEVKWDNGETNYYKTSDLKVVEDMRDIQLKPNNQKYTFKVGSCQNIDFNEIASNLSRENPIALVHNKTDQSQTVVVHPSLLRKADNLRIKPPEYHGFQRFYYLTTSTFDDWMKWAREVRAAEWGDLSNPCEIIVHMPEIV